MNPTGTGEPTVSKCRPGAPQLDDPRVAAALEAYLAAREAGQNPDRQALFDRHPDIAAALRECLEGLELVEGVAAAAGGGGPDPPADLGPEGVLGDFRLLRELGRGGMGIVYEAEQLSLTRRVALKVLPFAGTLDPRHLQRFRREAQAAAQLHHPHIVPVYFVGCERGVHFYAMQLIDGNSLADMIAQLRGPAWSGLGCRVSEIGNALPDPRHPIPDTRSCTAPVAALSTVLGRRDTAFYRRAAEVVAQAAEALEYAHALGIVHRDVKPANLLLDAAGHVWVTDFGLARFSTDAELTASGDLLGTLRYMSPEQALARHGLVDHRTDVYSLGATLYELLTLRPAIGGEEKQDVLRQIAFEEPAPPRKLARSIPAELETVTLKCLAKNAAERYATVGELADDLRRWLGDQTIKAKPPTPAQRAAKWARRHRPVVWSALAALLAVVVAVAGSVGWVARDRTLRREQAVLEAAAAWEDIDQLRRQGKWTAALAVTRRVETLLAGGGADPDLRRQFAELGRDLQMAADLEEIRLNQSDVKNERFDDGRADVEYAAAFRGFGIDVDASEPAEAAERIRAGTISDELVAALDDWAGIRERRGWRGEGHLRAVARAVDPDPWRNRLREALERRPLKVLEELAASAEVGRQYPSSVILLARSLWNAGATERAMAIIHQAQVLRPEDLWINCELGHYLRHTQPPRTDEATRYLMAAVAVRPLSPGTRVNLGEALKALGKLSEAEAQYRLAIQLKPNYAMAHLGLGNTLSSMGMETEATAEYRQAIQIKPEYAVAYLDLGNALGRRGKWADAADIFRQAIALQPDYAEAFTNLGNALDALGKPAEAMAEYRRATGLKPDLPQPRINLGNVLARLGKPVEAMAEYRRATGLRPELPEAHQGLGVVLQQLGQHAEAADAYLRAIQIKPEDAQAHYSLGNALAAQGKLTDAADAYRRALGLKPDYAEAHCNLADVFSRQGRFADALAAYRRGHELGSQQPNWRYPSARWVREAERLVALGAKLPKVLAGEAQPADAAERMALAKMCQEHKELYAASARFYSEAFAAQPTLAAGAARYNAACAAALAGSGQGKDAGGLDEQERSRLRGQALIWLRSELDDLRRRLDNKPIKSRPAILQEMQHWQRDTDFAGVRGPEELKKLPETERPEWQKLWEDVETLRKRAAEKE
jgi:serine/threonine protein kinase/Flp pilus assembly protein TadD